MIISNEIKKGIFDFKLDKSEDLPENKFEFDKMLPQEY
jgi:hypothetical protein